MKDIKDQNKPFEKENLKLETLAFISLLLVYIFLKFSNYVYTNAYILDMVLIPKIAINYALKESFYSGLSLRNHNYFLSS